MKKFLTTAFLFTLAAVAFAQGAPVAAQKSLEGQFVAHLSSPSPPPVPSAPP
jgi:F-type H+-transporting ATPase subunit c